MTATKVLSIIMAITMALTITLAITNTFDSPKQSTFWSVKPVPHEAKPTTLKRVSRFLIQKEEKPRSSDHCKKDDEICHILEGKNSTCCNNKCVDLDYDSDHCGACKRKCLHTEACCNGECVNLSYDKRHCGMCNNKCVPGGYCVYGMCDYA